MSWLTWQDEYESKVVSAEEAVKTVKSGDVIGWALGVTAPSSHLVDALFERADELRGVRIADSVPTRALKAYDPVLMDKLKGSFLYSSVLYNPLNRALSKTGNVDYVHVNSSDAGIRYGRTSNVAMLMVCPPEAGMINLGLTNFYTPEMIRGADVVIAEVNDQMPTVFGDNWIPISDFDYFVEHSSPIPQFLRKGEPSEIEFAIAENVASMIRDGDCLQMGIGTLPEAVVKLLGNKGKKDLGIHTEMFPMGLPNLVREGMVTNKLKRLDTGKTVATFCAGDNSMYEYVTRNSDCIFYPSSYINDPRVIAMIDNVVSINMDLEVDFSGQLAAEVIDYRLIGASGGQLDFVIGASWSKGGRALNVLPSTRKLSNGETVSTITAKLSDGAHITVPHQYSQYVVTEYGIADLFYKTRRERAEAVISIAHPDFRAELRKKAKKLL